MPYPNFHAARLKDPKQYDEVRQKKDEFGEGINVLYGIKGEGENRTSEVQAIRFAKDKFTPKQAREWLKEHDHKPILFEEATEEAEEEGMGAETKALWDELDAHLTGKPERAETTKEQDPSTVVVWKAFGQKYYMGVISKATQDLEGETVTSEGMDFSISLSRKYGYHSALYLEHQVPWTRVGRSLMEMRIGKNWIELGKFLDTPLAGLAYQALSMPREQRPKLSAGFLAPRSQRRAGRYTTVLKYDTSIVMKPAHPGTVIYVGGKSDMDEALKKVLKALGEDPEAPQEETLAMLKELFATAKSLDTVEKADKKEGDDPYKELMGKLEGETKALCEKAFAGYTEMQKKAAEYDKMAAAKKPAEEEKKEPVVEKSLDIEEIVTAISKNVNDQLESTLGTLSERLNELEAQVKSLGESEQMAEVVASLVRRLPEPSVRRPSENAEDLDAAGMTEALKALEKSLGDEGGRSFHPLAGLGMGAPGTREGGGV